MNNGYGGMMVLEHTGRLNFQLGLHVAQVAIIETVSYVALYYVVMGLLFTQPRSKITVLM